LIDSSYFGRKFDPKISQEIKNNQMEPDYFFKHESGLILSDTGDPWQGSEDCGFRSALLAAAHADIPMLVKRYELIQKGFLWQSDTFYDYKPLPEDQTYYLDKHFLSLMIT